MDDKDYMREMSTVERVELRIGAVTDHPTTRSSIRALNFDGHGDVDEDEDEDEDEDKEFVDDFEMSEYHFTLAQMVAKMTSLVNGLHPLVSSYVPVLQPVAITSPSLEPDSQVLPKIFPIQAYPNRRQIPSLQ
ncbi:hypothetical protein R1flu_013245 [Riccia fluitans]|uniref:Uncharacterized protein n=1 Tax=Riccia fluitans TaxID=41844 RepID=A0ABD1YDU1_9MARC